MPRDDGGGVRSVKRTDIYSVMLILSMVLLLGAVALSYHELSDHYDFWASRADSMSTSADDEGDDE